MSRRPVTVSGQPAAIAVRYLRATAITEDITVDGD
jgi:hypothetical protein